MVGGESLAKRDQITPNFDCFTFALQSSFILFHKSFLTSLVNKPYTKGVKHSEEVEWWRTFMVECVTLFYTFGSFSDKMISLIYFNN